MLAPFQASLGLPGLVLGPPELVLGPPELGLAPFQASLGLPGLVLRPLWLVLSQYVPQVHLFQAHAPEDKNELVSI